MPDPTLPEGMIVTPLKRHEDNRGSLIEVFRQSWGTGIAPVQWNVVESSSNVLRGFHVHVWHTDYLVLINGRMRLGLKDLRAGSPTAGLTTAIDLDPAARPLALTIPTGVAHGFAFPEAALLFYSVSRYWDCEDELACRFDDPDVGIDWQVSQPALSPRDEVAGTLQDMVEEYARKSAASVK
jgi:dTDP-4-dehydrorhamnose 3,5-epimerase